MKLSRCDASSTSAASTQAAQQIPESIAISKLGNRYLLYDAEIVSYIRREHNICGVLIGGLPQAPQQNVFLGLPLELMPEEALILTEKGVAHVVDDVVAHRSGFMGNGLTAVERRAFHAALRHQGVNAARESMRRAEERKKNALKGKLGTENWNDIPDDMLTRPSGRRKGEKPTNLATAAKSEAPSEDEQSLFASSSTSLVRSSTPPSDFTPADPEPFDITPTTSHPPLATQPPPPDASTYPIEQPPSYPLFKHLHGLGYFLSPGIRFGCQYMAYPGDPLRFHSHFLCTGLEWDREFDLMDLVGGGRLGTGVKKGYLIGGRQTVDGDATQQGDVRAFSIEWAGM